jgi:phosphoenolpyruvate carboxykinase (ATP)
VKEPSATFSTCFGAPFMPRQPGEYARMLVERMERWGAQAWLVNTGWTGGPYGTGERMNINHTRSMVRAALEGRLDGIPTVTDPIFGVQVPTHVPDVPAEVLQPRGTWPDAADYDRQAARLAGMFAENFERYAEGVGDDVRAAGPRVEG